MTDEYGARTDEGAAPRTAAEAVCSYGHAFVTHTGKPVEDCPMYEDHARLAAAVLGAAPRAEGLPEPGLDMTPEQTIDWWEKVAYSLGARAERAEDALRDLTQRVAEATIRFPTLTEDPLLRDSFHAASRLIEGVDRE